MNRTIPGGVGYYCPISYQVFPFDPRNKSSRQQARSDQESHSVRVFNVLKRRYPRAETLEDFRAAYADMGRDDL